MTTTRSLAPFILALVVLTAAGCSRLAGDDVARDNATIAARIDHRLGRAAPGEQDVMFTLRRDLKSERVACIEVKRGQGREARFIYRNGCLFTESDLPAQVFDRWRRDFCLPDVTSQKRAPNT